jgi:hypothetical protein
MPRHDTPDPDEVARLRTDLADAIADEQDAASRAAAAAEELRDLGIDPDQDGY